MDKSLLALLGLADNADAPAVLAAVKALVAQRDDLAVKMKDAATAALNTEADAFVKANAAKIKDPAKVKAQYVLNKDVTLALFASVADTPATDHQVINRQDGKPPVVLNTESDTAKARSDAVDAAAKKYNCTSRARAWELAQQDNPNLFAQ